MPPHIQHLLQRTMLLAAVVALAGCAIAQPRIDDPWQGFNRKAYAFNQAIDKVAIRPVAVTYLKVTNPPVREHVNNFFGNLLLPVAIGNDLLQAKPKRALESSGRFLVNLTIGFLGFFDPASHLGLAEDNNDFGVTLARWGFPEGPYMVLPFVGPTTARDIWRLPVDSYLFNPLSIYTRHHDYHYGQEYLPQLTYLITLRSRAINAESFLNSAYDPYAFLRDAYRQRRLYLIYYGNPPADAIARMQGLDQDKFDPDELLDQQHAWEKKNTDRTAPASSTGTPVQPAPATSSGG